MGEPLLRVRLTGPDIYDMLKSDTSSDVRCKECCILPSDDVYLK